MSVKLRFLAFLMLGEAASAAPLNRFRRCFFSSAPSMMSGLEGVKREPTASRRALRDNAPG